MTQAEQQRRRELKQQRRRLDRSAQAIAAANPRNTSHASTRSKQAKSHHAQADDLLRRRGMYDAMRARMREIAAELARNPLQSETPPAKRHNQEPNA
jgi:hypothetical protein